MALLTLPAVSPDWGYSNRKTPKILSSEFGDGYEQVIQDGINHIREKFTLTWTNAPDADKVLLDEFFTARGGVEFFNWTPPGEGSAKIYQCPNWAVVAGDLNAWNISADFKQQFTS